MVLREVQILLMHGECGSISHPKGEEGSYAKLAGRRFASVLGHRRVITSRAFEDHLQTQTSFRVLSITDLERCCKGVAKSPTKKMYPFLFATAVLL